MSGEQQAKLPAETVLRICRCNSFIAGSNACPHCGAGWAEGLTPVAKYILAPVAPKIDLEWALRELADGWISNNERDGEYGFYQNARRVLTAVASDAQQRGAELNKQQ